MEIRKFKIREKQFIFLWTKNVYLKIVWKISLIWCFALTLSRNNFFYRIKHQATWSFVYTSLNCSHFVIKHKRESETCARHYIFIWDCARKSLIASKHKKKIWDVNSSIKPIHLQQTQEKSLRCQQLHKTNSSPVQTLLSAEAPCWNKTENLPK